MAVRREKPQVHLTSLESLAMKELHPYQVNKSIPFYHNQ